MDNGCHGCHGISYKHVFFGYPSNVMIPIKECPCLVSNRRQFIWLDDLMPHNNFGR